MRSRGCQIDLLENRLLFASTPAEPRADSLGKAFDRGERQVLLDRLTNLSTKTHASLKSKLKTSIAQFDSALLSYMRTRSEPNFFFDPDQAKNIGSFIKNNDISFTDIKTHADVVTDSHLFPEQGSSATYAINLPDNINWIAPKGSTNPEFLHTMNRHTWWIELAWVNAITGGTKYAPELEYELASWSQQFPTMDTPAAWSKSDQRGWLLDTAVRAESWTWAYFGFLENSSFSGAENSLFLYKLLQTGDFLYTKAQATTDFQSNRSISLGKGLLYLGEMFPEFGGANHWEESARTLLFKSMDAQIYTDGSHIEQSPGYTYNVADDLLDARQLDRLNGIHWPKDEQVKLSNMIDSYWQFLSPNGTRPAIGDTYRNNNLGVFLKSDIVQGTTRWPAAKPRPRDVWLLGTNAVKPYVSKPPFPSSLGNRGKTYAMQDSGNYIMRSGNDKDARQIIFDAGPKGGVHGHFDLLSFEMSGYGRPLISDPGAYKYDTSASREYVISTKAHNTLNVDGQNTKAIEGLKNTDIFVSQWKTGSNFARFTATHRGYDYLKGAPIITRSLWYDLNGTALIVDWGDSSVRHNYQQSFNLQTAGNANNVTVDSAALSARTRYPSGGNVKIQGITTGETAVKGPLTFVTNTASGDFKDDAYRFTLNQSGKFVVFVTLITAYNGATPPDTSAKLISDPANGGAITVKLTKNGTSQIIDFVRPQMGRLSATAATRGTFNDIAFDSKNRLHMAYADRDSGALMYAVRDAKGNWSAPSIIDRAASSDANGSYQFVSVALDSRGNPGVAYFDGWNGDLRYALLNPDSQKWEVQTVDSKASTGLYPSLAFGRDDAPAISYYDRTSADLMLAQARKGKFIITPIDTTGDVGRASSLVLDPNRASITRWAIGYEDSARGNYRYAIQGDFAGGRQLSGFTNYLVEDLAHGGGYVSLAFYDSGSRDNKRYKPAMSYYDARETALRFAQSTDGGSKWSTQLVASKKVQGLYTNLFFDSAGKANIFYYNRSDNEATRAVLSKHQWTLFNLRAGGRELHTSVSAAGNIAYSTLNEKTGHLNAFVI